MTVGEALRAAVRQLQGATPTPGADAELLLAEVRGCSRAALRAYDTDALGDEQLQAYQRLIHARARGMPVAYLLGRKEFWSLELEVGPEVLVPRPETELLVEWGLECLRELRRPRLADLGTGSGAIALALAHERPDAEVLATDVSEPALEHARRNARRLGLDRVEFRQGNWFEPLANEREAGFDLLVSNPPYIAADDPHLAALAQEPRSALTDGHDGFSALAHLIGQARGFLRPGRWLLLEHGSSQGAAVRAAFHAAGFIRVATRQDLAGLDRVTGGQSP